MLCPRCDKENAETNKFCVYCGTSLIVEKPSEELPEEILESSEKEEKQFPPIFALLLILVLVGGVVFLLFSEKFFHKEAELPITESSKAKTEPILQPAQAVEVLKVEPKEIQPPVEIKTITPVELTGEWKGIVGINQFVRLFIKQDGVKLAGKMIYENIEESLEGEVKTDGQMFLKGTNYQKLRSDWNFNLDTFYGKIVSVGRLSGTYEDTAGNRGEWYVAKISDKCSSDDIAIKIKEPVINVTGSWQGASNQRDIFGNIRPMYFRMELIQTGENITGKFGESDPVQGSLQGIIKGTLKGNEIILEKSYTSKAFNTAVKYTGTVNKDGTEAKGKWSVRGVAGEDWSMKK